MYQGYPQNQYNASSYGQPGYGQRQNGFSNPSQNQYMNNQSGMMNNFGNNASKLGNFPPMTTSTYLPTNPQNFSAVQNSNYYQNPVGGYNNNNNNPSMYQPGNPSSGYNNNPSLYNGQQPNQMYNNNYGGNNYSGNEYFSNKLLLKKTLLQLVESMNDHRKDLNMLRETFRTKQGMDTDTITLTDFKYCLKVFFKDLPIHAESVLIEEFKINAKNPNTQRIHTSNLLKTLEIYKSIYHCIETLFNQILEAYEAGKNDLFDLFHSHDNNHGGLLDKKQFESVLYKFQLIPGPQILNDVMTYFDLNDDGYVSYTEFEESFNKFLQKNGKNIEDIKRSTYFQDVNSYWGTQLFLDIQYALNQRGATILEEIANRGSQYDNLSKFEFSDLLFDLLKDNANEDVLNEQIEKLSRELLDNNTINIMKFQERFEHITSHAGNGMQPLNRMNPNKSIVDGIFNALLDCCSQIGKPIETYLADFGLKYSEKAMMEDNFIKAIISANIPMDQNKQFALSNVLDPQKTRWYNIARLFEESKKRNANLAIGVGINNKPGYQAQPTGNMYGQPNAQSQYGQPNAPGQYGQFEQSSAPNQFGSNGYPPYGQNTSMQYAKPNGMNQIPGNMKQIGAPKLLNFKPGINFLNDQEITNLVEYLEELNAYCKQNNILLLSEFMKADTRKLNTLSLDEIKSIFQKLKIHFKDLEFNLIFKAYNKPPHLRVDYKRLCQDMNNLQTSPPQPSNAMNDNITMPQQMIDQTMKKFYDGIRRGYSTLEEFFNEADKMKKTCLKIDDFVQSLRDLKIKIGVEFNAVEMEGIYRRLCPPDRNVIYFIDFSNALQYLQDIDAKDVLTKIISPLIGSRSSIYQRVETYPRNSSMMKFAYLISALHSTNPNLDEKDVIFLLSYLGSAQLNHQTLVNYEEIISRMQSKISEFRIVGQNEFDILFKRTPNITSPNNGMKKTSTFSKKGPAVEIIDALVFKSKEDIIIFFNNLSSQNQNKKMINLQEFKKAINRYSKGTKDEAIIRYFNFISGGAQAFTCFDLLNKLGPEFEVPINQSNAGINNKIPNLAMTSKSNILPPKRSNTPSSLNNTLPDDKPINSRILNQEIFNTERTESQYDYTYASDIIKRTAWGSHIFEQIINAIEENKQTFEFYFRTNSYDQRMLQSTVLSKINNDLRIINMELNQLLQELTANGAPGMVDINLFKECYDFYKANIKNQVTITTEIYQKLKHNIIQKGKTFDEIFSIYDFNGSGLMSHQDFIVAIETEFQDLNLTPEEIYHLEMDIKNKFNQLSLQKLKLNLGPEIIQYAFDPTLNEKIKFENDKVDTIINQLREMFKYNSPNVLKAFENLDLDQNGSLDFDEFSKALKQIQPNIYREDAELLFKRFDHDGDGKISKSEFVQIIDPNTGPGLELQNANRIWEEAKKIIQTLDSKTITKLLHAACITKNQGANVDTIKNFLRILGCKASENQVKAIFATINPMNKYQLTIDEFYKTFSMNLTSNLLPEHKVIDELRWASAIFEDMDWLLSLQESQLLDYFYGYNKKIPIPDFIEKIWNLSLAIEPFQLERLTNILTDKADPTKINLGLLQSVYSYYNTAKTMRLEHFLEKHFGEIHKALQNATKQNADFDSIFKNQSGDDCIPSEKFKEILFGQIGLTNDRPMQSQVNLLIKGLINDKKLIALPKLRAFIFNQSWQIHPSFLLSTTMKNLPPNSPSSWNPNINKQWNNPNPNPGWNNQQVPPGNLNTSWGNQNPNIGFNGWGNNPNMGASKISQGNQDNWGTQMMPPNQNPFMQNMVNNQLPMIESLMEKLREGIKDMPSQNVMQLFNRVGHGNKIQLPEFHQVVHGYINDSLTEAELRTLFGFFDREGNGVIDKTEFILRLIKTNSDDVLLLLEPHRSFFEMVQTALTQEGQDPIKLFRPYKKSMTYGAFKQGLVALHLEPEKHESDLRKIASLLLLDNAIVGDIGIKTELNFEIFMEALNKFKKVDYKPKESFTPDELASIEHVCNIIKDINKDHPELTFDKIFRVKDRKDTGFITMDDMQNLIENNPYGLDATRLPLALFYDYFKDQSGNVPLVTIRDKLFQDVAPVTQSFKEFIKTVKAKYNNDLTIIVSLFDENGSKSIDNFEFLKTLESKFGISRDVAKSMWNELNPKSIGPISILEFIEFIDDEDESKVDLLNKVRDFVNQHRFDLLKQLNSLDAERRGFLDVTLVKMAFNTLQFPMSNEGINYLIDKYQVARAMGSGNKIQYADFVDKICNSDPYRDVHSDIDRLLKTIKNQLVIVKEIDLVEIFRRRDPNGEKMVDFRIIIEELVRNDLILNKDDKILLSSFLKPDQHGRVNYYDFAKYVLNGNNVSAFNPEMLRLFINSRDLLLRIKTWFVLNNHTVETYFKTNDEWINRLAFTNGLNNMGFRNNDESMRNMIQQLVNKSQMDLIHLSAFNFTVEHAEHIPRARITPGDFQIIEACAQGVREAIYEEKTSYDILFGPYINAKRYYINPNELLGVLVRSLGFDKSDPNINRFTNLISDDQKQVSLLDLQFMLEGNAPIIQQQAPPMNISFNPNQTNPALNKGSGSFAPGPPINVQQYGGTNKGQLYPPNMQNTNPQGKMAPNMNPNGMAKGPGFQPLANNPNQKLMNPAFGTVKNTLNVNNNISRSINNPNQPSGQLNNQYQQPYSQAPPNNQLNLQPIKFSGDLIQDIKLYFRNRKVSNLDRFKYYDINQEGLISKDVFIEKTLLMKIEGVTNSIVEQLFTQLDASNNQVISEQEFRLVFDDDNESQADNAQVTEAMELDIRKLFDQIDKDKSGFIDINELSRCLQIVGGNATNADIQAIFDTFDKDKDGKISYSEFYEVMAKKMKRDMLQIEDLLSELRAQFKAVDIYNRRVIDIQQLDQALKNMAIDIPLDNLTALFYEMDKDQTGTIDIDEFILYMMNPEPNGNQNAASAIVAIKGAKKLGISDLYNTFKNMPGHFVPSFTRDVYKRLENLPSTTLKPRLDPSGFNYFDILPEISQNNAVGGKNQPAVQMREIRPLPSAVACEIKLLNATGIPIPDLKIVNSGDILARELRVCLFNSQTQKYTGNSCSFYVEWKKETEDEWGFQPQKKSGENSLLLRMNSFDDRKESDKALMLIFEFVIFYKANNNTAIEMSSGWAYTNIINLRNLSGVQKLTLYGGNPSKSIGINQSDIRANRTGIRQIFKGQVGSKIKVEIVQQKSLSQDITQKLDTLPYIMILNKNALTCISAYREYMASLLKVSSNGGLNQDLASDLMGRVFRKTIDCEDTWDPFFNFWKTNIEPRLLKSPASVAIDFLLKCMNRMYLLFSCLDFKFIDSDPTIRTYCDMALRQKRSNLLYQTLQNILLDCNIQTKQPYNANNQNIMMVYKPFHISELMEEENDEMFLQQLKKLRMKQSMKFLGFNNNNDDNILFSVNFRLSL